MYSHHGGGFTIFTPPLPDRPSWLGPPPESVERQLSPSPHWQKKKLEGGTKIHLMVTPTPVVWTMRTDIMFTRGEGGFFVMAVIMQTSTLFETMLGLKTGILVLSNVHPIIKIGRNQILKKQDIIL